MNNDKYQTDQPDIYKKQKVNEILISFYFNWEQSELRYNNLQYELSCF